LPQVNNCDLKISSVQRDCDQVQHAIFMTKVTFSPRNSPAEARNSPAGSQSPRAIWRLAASCP